MATYTLTQGAFYTMIGIYSFAGLCILILFLIAFFTPALIFLKAKLSRSSVIYLLNRAQSGRFVVAKHYAEGIAEVKKVGPFIMTENSHTIEQKSKVGLFFAFGEYATTLPLKWVYVLNKLKERAIIKGEKIKNADILDNRIGLKFNETLKVWENIDAAKKQD